MLCGVVVVGGVCVVGGVWGGRGVGLGAVGGEGGGLGGEHTFIQTRFHPMTLSSKTLSSNFDGFHPKKFSSNDIFIQ